MALNKRVLFYIQQPLFFFLFSKGRIIHVMASEQAAGAGIITLNLYLLHRAAFVYHKRERKHTISQSHALGRARASFQVRITHFFLRFLGNRARCVQKKGKKSYITNVRNSERLDADILNMCIMNRQFSVHQMIQRKGNTSAPHS